MENAKKILVCPLNWGLGHATRCIPLIRRFLQEGKEVVVAADGYPLEALRNEFPQLTFVAFPSYKVRYGKGNSQVWAMLGSLPNILAGIFKEHRKLKQIAAEHKVDTVLSDNRFGLWHSGIRSIYMTHQLMVKMPRGLGIFEPLVAALHRFIIKKYDLCFVPDERENGGWAGDLTHKYALPANAQFIGLLSRFVPPPAPPSARVAEKVFAVLSGVEPQRSMLENILIEALSQRDFSSLIVSGLPQKEQTKQQIGNAKVVSHLPSAEMEKYLRHTATVICRSGYSSIMDLAVLKRTAILVPTPGQTEQEYLGCFLAENHKFVCVKQSGLREFLKGMPPPPPPTRE